MNITVNAAQLAKKLKLVEKIVASKTVLPILLNTLIRAEHNELHLSTTDTEVSLTTSCPATITTPGVITIPVKRLLDLVNEITDEQIHLTVDKGYVRIAAGQFKSRLQVLPADDFPTLPTLPEGGTLLPGGVFRAMIKKVRSAISDADKRYFMNGALLSLTDNAMALITTDGKRLALTTAPRVAGLTNQIVIPTKTLDVLMSDDSTDDLLFAMTDRQLFFVSEDSVLSSRMIDGKFPAYQRIIPRDNTHIITVTRLLLLSALKRVSLVAGDSRELSVLIEPGALSLQSASHDVGDAVEHLNVTYTGPSMKFKIDWTLMMSFLDVAVNQQITIALKDPQSAMLFTDGGDYINVVMTMRN